jgi:putative ABC transport system ATP-binding protein
MGNAMADTSRLPTTDETPHSPGTGGTPAPASNSSSNDLIAARDRDEQERRSSPLSKRRKRGRGADSSPSQAPAEPRFEPPINKTLGEPVIEFENVRKSYTLKGHGEAVQALRGITLSDRSEFYAVRRGEFVMIRGPSGGGKTTMLNCMGTIDLPTSGCIRLLGRQITANGASESQLARLRLKRVGFVFQTFNLLGTLSAYENVELPMTVLGKLGAAERKRRVCGLLAQVGLEDRMGHLPSELSGGEQQRVTIARALGNNPEVLLLDEPTGDLDTRTTIAVMNLLLRINRDMKMTMVMVTHNPDLECYADRVLYVKDGVFERQELNEEQQALELESYVAHLNSQGEA